MSRLQAEASITFAGLDNVTAQNRPVLVQILLQQVAVGKGWQAGGV